MPCRELNAGELGKFFRILGRAVRPSIIEPDRARALIKLHKREAKEARTFRPWPGGGEADAQLCVNRAAKNCIDFILTRQLEGNESSWDYVLPNPLDTAEEDLVRVHLRVPPQCNKLSSTSHAAPSFREYPTISDLQLHPALRRRSFLRGVLEGLAEEGRKMLILQNVLNPSFSYHLFKRSLAPGTSVIQLSDYSFEDYEDSLCPPATFAIKLSTSSLSACDKTTLS